MQASSSTSIGIAVPLIVGGRGRLLGAQLRNIEDRPKLPDMNSGTDESGA